ncbi:hypothetical protein [Siminovitchia terrae]|uniref:hypothetical protein n=1 Tax=Siminovitchia terrae TaxID=1914933 RepID=UPI0028AE9306|nr:hypothetical protein [Siminovitchia terrae]
MTEIGLYFFGFYFLLIILSLFNRTSAKILWIPIMILTFRLMKNNALKSFKFVFVRFGIITIQVTISILIKLFYIIVLYKVIDKEFPKIDLIFLFFRELIFNSSSDLALAAILLFFFFEYILYKKIIECKYYKKIIEEFSRSMLGDKAKYVSKYLVNDFTVLIAFLGFLPFLIDSAFSDFNFSEEMKESTFWFFSLVLVPYVHLIYSNVK